MKTFSTSRNIPASTDQIFAAISSPDRLKIWWGPAGFRNTNISCDFRKGGKWSLIMHSPDGADYPNEYIFSEIIPSKKVVFTHEQQPQFTLTLSLISNESGTTVTWDQTFENAEVASSIEHIVVPANEQNLDKLVSEVKKTS